MRLDRMLVIEFEIVCHLPSTKELGEIEWKRKRPNTLISWCWYGERTAIKMQNFKDSTA